jgi:histidinol-phosphate aminotransferase
LSAYTPGEQPKHGAKVVKLNTNEASFPPPPSVLEAAAVSAEQLRKYPDPRATELREAIAQRHGVSADHVIVGNGSDDILTILIRTFVPPGGRVAFPWPTYSLYTTLVKIQGAEPIEVDWDERWDLPTEALLLASADAVFVVNPNAPSGTRVSRQMLDDLAERLSRVPLLIDEAYADYADTDCIPLVASRENVVVSRSLSKGFALAGVRLGYAIARPEVVAEMDKVRDSYNVDAVAQAIGLAAMREGDYYEAERAKVKQRRRELSSSLSDLGFDVTPSQTNFVFARHREAGRLYHAVREAGVLVRYWDQPGLADALRVTVGTSEENQQFLDVLRGKL